MLRVNCLLLRYSCAEIFSDGNNTKTNFVVIRLIFRHSHFKKVSKKLPVNMHSTEQLQQLIKQEIETMQVKNSPADLYDPIRYLLTLGGKRMRPALCLAAAEACASADAAALPLACA